MISVDLLNRFEDLVKYPISQLLQDYIDFVEYDLPQLTSFYKGEVKELNINSSNELDRLREEVSNLFDIIRTSSNSLSSGEFWNLLEYFEEIRTKLDTVNKLPKYLRSSIFRGMVSSSVEVEYSTRQNQTLEQMVDELGSDDAQQDWIEIALKNNLNEEQYTTDGGVLLKINLQGARTMRILSVVDIMVGDRIYGKDISSKITFDSNENDLKVLNYKETLSQTVKILSSLKQNDNPEFPQNGIQKALVVGINQNSVSFPVLLRQLYDTFGNDDTLKTFMITNIERKEDGLFIEFNIESVTGELITENLKL